MASSTVKNISENNSEYKNPMHFSNSWISQYIPHDNMAENETLCTNFMIMEFSIYFYNNNNNITLLVWIISFYTFALICSLNNDSKYLDIG